MQYDSWPFTVARLPRIVYAVWAQMLRLLRQYYTSFHTVANHPHTWRKSCIFSGVLTLVTHYTIISATESVTYRVKLLLNLHDSGENVAVTHCSDKGYPLPYAP